MIIKKTVKLIFLILFVAITIGLVFNFTYTPDITASKMKAPSHGSWTNLLQQHVSAEGWVDYAGFKASQTQLDAYLAILSSATPSGDWSEQEKLAYWINAYNAFTVKVIVDNYPLESIRDLHPKPYIPLLNTVWHRKFFNLNGRPTNLDEIEHKILRKQFDEPRIHFAINCASVSCPVLRNEAYTAEKLEAQLTDQAKKFLSSEIRNTISQDKIQISRIFQWFKGDFTQKGSLIDFLNQYSPVEISEDAKISHLDYDWGLNGERGEKRGGKRKERREVEREARGGIGISNLSRLPPLPSHPVSLSPQSFVLSKLFN